LPLFLFFVYRYFELKKQVPGNGFPGTIKIIMKNFNNKVRPKKQGTLEKPEKISKQK
jgi:hypothetical protein